MPSIPSLYANLPYDAVRDFTPLALIAHAPVAVVVHPAQPVNSLAELVALAKKMPGKLNYGSAGVGTPGHLTGEMFKAAAGIDLQHVPYKGSAPAVTDLIGGQIQIMFDPLQSVLSNVQGGKLRALAVSQQDAFARRARRADHCRVRLRDFETTAWWGVFAPAKLPRCAYGFAGGGSRAHRRERRLPQQARAARRHAVTDLAGARLRISSAAKSPNGARPCAMPA